MMAKIRYIFYMLLVVNVSLVLYYFNQRDIFHTDEQWSYAHANSTQGAYLSPSVDSYMRDKEHSISYKWLDNIIFHDYLTVQENERFVYGHIGENLKVVEHPPLYFLILHTICSFFPDVFSKWHGGVLNILAFTLTLILLYKLSKLVLKDDVLALFPVFFWGFSNIGLGTALYLRMYMLQTFFAVGLAYQTLLMLDEKQERAEQLILIYLYSALGILTQYNSLIFSFFMAMATGSVLLCRKNWCLLLSYGGIMLLSVLTLFAVFPDAFDVLLHSQRGTEIASRTTRFGSFLFLLLKIENLLDVCLTQLFCFRAVYGGVFVAFFLLGFMAVCNRQRNADIRLLLFVCVCTFVLLAFIMPEMYVFWSRYFMSVMPVAAILTIYLIIHGGVYLNLPKRYIVFLLSLLVTLNSLFADFSHRSAYSFLQNMKTDMQFEKDVHKRLIVVSGVSSFFSGVELYWNTDGVFRGDDICDNIEERLNADYLLAFNSIIKSVGDEDKIKEKMKDAKCMSNLEFVSVIKISADFVFDLYRVVK